MPISRFFDVLPLLRDEQDEQLGLCLMGPTGTGDTLIWMRGWAWQQDDENVAASTGEAGVHVPGAHPLSKSQKPPFAAPGIWMVQTAFETPSEHYNPEKPVLVQALALVERYDERAIVQWSQAVMIRHGYHDPRDDEPGFEHQHSDG
jgi:hypothetical protein